MLLIRTTSLLAAERMCTASAQALTLPSVLLTHSKKNLRREPSGNELLEVYKERRQQQQPPIWQRMGRLEYKPSTTTKCSRFSPDSARLAVCLDGKVEVRATDGLELEATLQMALGGKFPACMHGLLHLTASIAVLDCNKNCEISIWSNQHQHLGSTHASKALKRKLRA